MSRPIPTSPISARVEPSPLSQLVDRPTSPATTGSPRPRRNRRPPRSPAGGDVARRPAPRGCPTPEVRPGRHRAPGQCPRPEDRRRSAPRPRSCRAGPRAAAVGAAGARGTRPLQARRRRGTRRSCRAGRPVAHALMSSVDKPGFPFSIAINGIGLRQQDRLVDTPKQYPGVVP